MGQACVANEECDHACDKACVPELAAPFAKLKKLRGSRYKQKSVRMAGMATLGQTLPGCTCMRNVGT